MTLSPNLKGAFAHPVLKVISGLNNFNAASVAATVKAADLGGATFVDIAADVDLLKLAKSLTKLPICVSAVEPEKFVTAVAAGADFLSSAIILLFHRINLGVNA